MHCIAIPAALRCSKLSCSNLLLPARKSHLHSRFSASTNGEKYSTSCHLRSRPGQACHESDTELHPHSRFKVSDCQPGKPGKDGVTGDSSSSDDEEQVRVMRINTPTTQMSSSVPLARPPIRPNPTSASTARSPAILSPPASQRPHAGTPKATRHQPGIAGAPDALAPSVLRPPPTPHEPPPSASTARPSSSTQQTSTRAPASWSGCPCTTRLGKRQRKQ
ncbi:hypothetical protein BCR44DRAFT_256641 [Catenaria anguillulae PL171]|uniref:Uncharacterized protein n=1 Tax=Catenaria anguillulae PL171 TaxID=765915 RepID=A0A1Y2HKQ6_9FUNG|nr:hypothetical protein BCR44DRAFT_256641 [Catenaria anguillulae PL171]